MEVYRNKFISVLFFSFSPPPCFWKWLAFSTVSVSQPLTGRQLYYCVTALALCVYMNFCYKPDFFSMWMFIFSFYHSRYIFMCIYICIYISAYIYIDSYRYIYMEQVGTATAYVSSLYIEISIYVYICMYTHVQRQTTSTFKRYDSCRCLIPGLKGESPVWRRENNASPQSKLHFQAVFLKLGEGKEKSIETERFILASQAHCERAAGEVWR